MRPPLAKSLLLIAGLCVLPTLAFAGSIASPNPSRPAAAHEAGVPVVGAVLNPGAIEANPGCGPIKISCAAVDYDGSSAMGPGDISVWLSAYFAGPPYNAIFDLDGDGLVGAADLSILVCLFFTC